MGELEEKLSSLLSNPAALEQVMGVVRALAQGGGEKPGDFSAVQSAQADTGAEQAAPAFGKEGADKSSFMGLDPKTAAFALKLLNAYSDQDSRHTALLNALKPFVSLQRREKIDRAQQVMRIAKVARQALDGMIGGASNV